MSGNASDVAVNSRIRPQQRMDSRVQFTRDVLGDALIALMQERRLDQITVAEILQRAGVGRSTFYTHFSDKQDLFLSEVEDFLLALGTLLERTEPGSPRLVPIRELFSHVSQSTEVFNALARSGKLAEVYALGTGVFARSIEARLARERNTWTPPESRAACHTLAASVFSLLDWWLLQAPGRLPASHLSPSDMDALFHRLARTGMLPVDM